MPELRRTVLVVDGADEARRETNHSLITVAWIYSLRRSSSTALSVCGQLVDSRFFAQRDMVSWLDSVASCVAETRSEQHSTREDLAALTPALPSSISGRASAASH